MDLLDSNLDSNYDKGQMRRMILAASLCITRIARLRPGIVKASQYRLGNFVLLLNSKSLIIFSWWLFYHDRYAAFCKEKKAWSHGYAGKQIVCQM